MQALQGVISLCGREIMVCTWDSMPHARIYDYSINRLVTCFMSNEFHKGGIYKNLKPPFRSHLG